LYLRRLERVFELAYTLTKMTLKTFIWLIYGSKLTQKTKDHKVKIGMEIKI
jgi:hypothetical protein